MATANMKSDIDDDERTVSNIRITHPAVDHLCSRQSRLAREMTYSIKPTLCNNQL